MRLKDIMTQDVELVEPDMPLSEVALKMRDLDIGSLPVGENDRLVGVITDRDITIRAVAEGKDPNRCSVRDVMSEGVSWCYEDQDVEEAAQLMVGKQIRRLPVLNRDKRLVGIVSLADLSLHCSKSLAGEAVQEISKPN